MSDSGVILFYTTAAVMRAEKMLVKNSLTVKLIPPPRQFSSDCGIALQFNWTDNDKIIKILSEAAFEIASVHRL